ncbi:MAG: response regulator [Butyrivibrio sp.]|nr:response regulator [Butyrivibrio sp.]
MGSKNNETKIWGWIESGHMIWQRRLICGLLMLFALIMTASSTARIDAIGELSTLKAVMLSLMNFSPMMLVGALCGGIPVAVTGSLLFLYHVICHPELAWMSVTYLMAGTTCYYLSLYGCYRGKGLRIAIILPAIQMGPIWGGFLGMAAGLGFSEFRRFLNYFVTELPEVLLCTLILWLIFNKTSDRVRDLFYCAQYYMEEPEPAITQKLMIRRSRLGHNTTIFIILLVFTMGIFAVLLSNTLVPGLFFAMLRDEVTQSVQTHSMNSWNLWTTVELEHQVSGILRELPALGIELNNVNELLAFDVKLVMLVLTVIIPSAIFANTVIQHRIARPIVRMADGVQGIIESTDPEELERALDMFRALDIHNGDETEALFKAFVQATEVSVGHVWALQHQKQLEEDLRIARAASEAKSNFLSNMSHEIRTPINAMLGFNVMILRESLEPTILSYANSIQSAGRTLLSLVNDILDFSRIESGRMEIIPVEYDLSAIIREVVGMATTRAADKGLELKTLINPETPRALFGDEIRIKQCITNLMTNAVKYTEEGTVTLSATYRKVDEEHIGLRVTVTDTGIGIKAEDLNRLFEPFERVDEKRNRTIEGTGLGLNIVRRILSMMNTELQVKSTYGEGSIFSFEVVQRVRSWEPIGIVQVDMKGGPGAAPAGGPPGGPPGGIRFHTTFQAPDAHLLVVDDTLVNLKVVEGLLRQTLMQVDTVDSGDAAIQLVKEKHYDVIFMDHRMPGKDGIETFREIRALPGNPCKDTAIIALTANVLSGVRETFLEEGFDEFMSKPVDPGQMEDILMRFLPQSLIIHEGDPDFDKDAIAASMGGPEAAEMVQFLLKLPGIDAPEGARNCGGPLLLKEALINFYMGIDQRADTIEQLLKDGDIKNYTIEVHGLKSSSRIIGAAELSGKAAHLEACGEEQNVEELKRLTPDLLELYRSYNQRILPLIKREEEKEDEAAADKPEIPAEELEQAFAGMRECVEAGLFDEADEILKQLSDYRIPAEQRGRMTGIKQALAAVDTEALLKLL